MILSEIKQLAALCCRHFVYSLHRSCLECCNWYVVALSEVQNQTRLISPVWTCRLGEDRFNVLSTESNSKSRRMKFKVWCKPGTNSRTLACTQHNVAKSSQWCKKVKPVQQSHSWNCFEWITHFSMNMFDEIGGSHKTPTWTNLLGFEVFVRVSAFFYAPASSKPAHPGEGLKNRFVRVH